MLPESSPTSKSSQAMTEFVNVDILRVVVGLKATEEAAQVCGASNRGLGSIKLHSKTFPLFRAIARITFPPFSDEKAREVTKLFGLAGGIGGYCTPYCSVHKYTLWLNATASV